MSDDIRYVSKGVVDQRVLSACLKELANSKRLNEKSLSARLKKYRGAGSGGELVDLGYDKATKFLSMAQLSIEEVESIYPEIVNLEVSSPQYELMVQYPGQMLPIHIDGYRSYRRNNNTADKPIVRFLVALNDWSPGHHFFVGGSVWHAWRSGDVITWKCGEEHGSANCGRTPKITLSVTGIACT